MTPAWHEADLQARLLAAVGALRASTLPPEERLLADRIAADLVELLARLDRPRAEKR